jgi:hypothetical protein
VQPGKSFIARNQPDFAAPDVVIAAVQHVACPGHIVNQAGDSILHQFVRGPSAQRGLSRSTMVKNMRGGADRNVRAGAGYLIPLHNANLEHLAPTLPRYE